MLQDHGITTDHLARLRGEPDYAKRVAAFMLRGGIEGSIHQKLARAVMGKNFFGVEDWAATPPYNARFTKKQLRLVTEFPWGEDILNSICPLCGKVVKDCQFAFLGLDKLNGAPLTVAKWLTLHPADGQPKFYFNSDPWHAGQPHTDIAVMEYRWHLLHKEIVPNSMGKTPEEQAALLPAEYEAPSTIAEVTKDILVFRNTGERPNGSRWAACKERTIATARYSRAGRVSCVGLFDGHGLRVGHWSGSRGGDVGVGASRQSILRLIEIPSLRGYFVYRSLVDLIQPPSIRPISSISSCHSTYFLAYYQGRV